MPVERNTTPAPKDAVPRGRAPVRPAPDAAAQARAWRIAVRNGLI